MATAREDLEQAIIDLSNILVAYDGVTGGQSQTDARDLFALDFSTAIDNFHNNPGASSPLYQTLTDQANISWSISLGPTAKVTLEGNRTLDNPTGIIAGKKYALFVVQGSGGSKTLSYGSKYKFAGGGAPTLSSSAGELDILVFESDGTNLYMVSITKNIS